MITPHYKNVNTISLKFIKGNRNYKDVIKLIRDHLGLTKDNLLGVGFAGKDSVHVRFNEEDTYEQISDRYSGKQFDLDQQTSITVIDISKYKIKVSMKNIPFTVRNSVLANILSLHGQVDSIHVCYHSKTEDDDFLTGLPTMERYAIMKSITTPIPSTYFLNLTQSYIYFSYPNQQKTCTKCGDLYHHGGECSIIKTTAPSKRANVVNFSYTEFPNLNPPTSWINSNIKIPSTALTPIHQETTAEYDTIDIQSLLVSVSSIDLQDDEHFKPLSTQEKSYGSKDNVTKYTSRTFFFPKQVPAHNGKKNAPNRSDTTQPTQEKSHLNATKLNLTKPQQQNTLESDPISNDNANNSKNLQNILGKDPLHNQDDSFSPPHLRSKAANPQDRH